MNVHPERMLARAALHRALLRSEETEAGALEKALRKQIPKGKSKWHRVIWRREIATIVGKAHPTDVHDTGTIMQSARHWSLVKGILSPAQYHEREFPRWVYGEEPPFWTQLIYR